MSKIRGSKIRGSEIRVSEIRISSNHRELHGAIFSLQNSKRWMRTRTHTERSRCMSFRKSSNGESFRASHGGRIATTPACCLEGLNQQVNEMVTRLRKQLLQLQKPKPVSISLEDGDFELSSKLEKLTNKWTNHTIASPNHLESKFQFCGGFVATAVL